jgi:lyso-ornithine lipid O-acyltransferase
MVLAFSLCQCVMKFVLLRLQGTPSDADRALCLHRSCQLVLHRLGFELRVTGEPPKTGLIASNHLSYLDILFYGAALPCVFVAKTEVRAWPMLGLLAALGGTVFIDRRRAASAAEAATRIQKLLEAGVLVLIFPEGTSSDGAGVLRFFPSLFEPAVRAAAPVTAAAIGYSASGRAAERDLCYYGDISFAPHLLTTLQLPQIFAEMRFAPAAASYDDRKQAAVQLRDAVVDLRTLIATEEGNGLQNTLL